MSVSVVGHGVGTGVGPTSKQISNGAAVAANADVEVQVTAAATITLPPGGLAEDQPSLQLRLVVASDPSLDIASASVGESTAAGQIAASIPQRLVRNAEVTVLFSKLDALSVRIGKVGIACAVLLVLSIAGTWAVRAFRSGALTLPWGEDYSWQTPIGSQQMTTLLLDFFRAGKRHGTTKTTTQTKTTTETKHQTTTPNICRRRARGARTRKRRRH